MAESPATALTTSITHLASHPLPLSEEEAAELCDGHPMFQDVETPLHPDEIHERYKDVLAENADWRVFRSHIYGQEGYIYAWNHQLGTGLRINDEDGAFESFAEVLAAAAEADING